MAVPKKNHSRQRQNKRRANWKGSVVQLAVCSNCGATKRPHHICGECGYYNGKQYIEPKATADSGIE